MTDTTNPAPPVSVMVDESNLKTTFINSYRLHTTQEEAVVDLGFNMPDPNGAPGTLLFQIAHRVIMSHSQLKKLAASLTGLAERIG